MLEKNLEREVASNLAATKAHMGGANVTKAYIGVEANHVHVDGDDEGDEGAEDEESLEPTPLAALDNVYEEGGDDELMDLGVQMGKVRLCRWCVDILFVIEY